MGDLESYETRLWFVILFIPVIPVGLKRIIDECLGSTRHYSVKADAYEQAKQLQISAYMERFRREPSPEAAIEAHGQLLDFHEHQQAAGYRQTALVSFPGRACLRATLASQLEEMSTHADSGGLFREVLELDPELPEARIGVARREMAEGNLDEAHDLLDFLLEPGAGRHQALASIDLLSAFYQRAGRHAEALGIAEVLLREIPNLQDNHKFRAFVRKSEKALGQPDSLLAARRFSLSGLLRSEGSHYAPWQRKLAIRSIAATLLVAGLAVHNEYIRRHRSLHVLNATGQVVQLQVDDQPSVAATGLSSLTVPEGDHVIKVPGPVEATYYVGIGSDYFDRWSSKPVWILNVGGEAVVEDVIHINSA